MYIGERRYAFISAVNLFMSPPPIPDDIGQILPMNESEVPTEIHEAREQYGRLITVHGCCARRSRRAIDILFGTPVRAAPRERIKN